MHRRRAAVALAFGVGALAVLTASSSGVASESGIGMGVDPPAVPQVPNIPGAKKVRIAFTVSGTQRSVRSDRRSSITGGCQRESNAETDETWTFERKSPVVLEFLQIRKRLMLNRRVGRRVGDTAFETSGTVTRTTNGTGLTFTGPPPCSSSHPLSTETCDASFPVKRDLRLSYDTATGRLFTISETYDLGHKYSQDMSPVKKCGGSFLGYEDSVVPLGGLVPTYAYPAFAEIRSIHSPQGLLSGKTQHIHRYREIMAPDPAAGTSDMAYVTLDMTLKRLKAKKKRKR